MEPSLTPECRALIDRARLSLPAEDAPLDYPTLLGAFSHVPWLQSQIPWLALRLRCPESGTIHPHGPLKLVRAVEEVLSTLSRSIAGRPITTEELLSALICDEVAGFQALRLFHFSEDEIDRVRKELKSVTGWKTSELRAEAIEYLRPFGVMLTEYPPGSGGFTGRDRAMQGLVQALLLPKFRTAILVGPKRAGKTALVKEFVRRLAARESSIPEPLRDHDVLAVDGVSRPAERTPLRALFDLLVHQSDVLRTRIVLFADNLEGFSTEDFAALQQVLRTGNLAFILTATEEFYLRSIEHDTLLKDGHHTRIDLQPPDTGETLAMLEARRPNLEQAYDVRLPGEMLLRTIQLTDERLPERPQPEKSIRVLERACVRAITGQPPRSEISEQDIMATLAEAPVPAPAVRLIDRAAIHERLLGEIAGQDDVMAGLARAVARGMGVWRPDTGPRGVFVFAGPTSVGKTETAKCLARLLGGCEEALIEVDCNTLAGGDPTRIEFQLTGTPQGYAGYSDGSGLLTPILERPLSVVLFDEFEKAGKYIGQTVLQILKPGIVRDCLRRPLDFRGAFIVFTTNAGIQYEAPKELGFNASPVVPGPRQGRVEDVKLVLSSLGLGQEFFARVDDWFIFQALTEASRRRIFEMKLGRLRDRARAMDMILDWREDVPECLAASWESFHGAREIGNTLHHLVGDQLTEAQGRGELVDVERIEIEVAPASDPSGLAPGVSAATRRRQGRTLVITLG